MEEDWFVTCIMIYYIVLYFIQHLMLNRLKWAFGICSILIVIWYLAMNRPTDYNMYGATYFKWGHYFLFMLQGAMLGISQKKWKFSFKSDLLKLLGCIVIYYTILFAGRKIEPLNNWLIISLIPLLYITFYFYKICNSEVLKKCYNHPIIGWWIKFIGGLCLEIYLIQSTLFTDKMNSIFPLNLFIMFFIILIGAYIPRCLSRLFAQTFRTQEYDWKEIIKMT